MSSASSIAISGLSAAQWRLASAAHNIANAATPGFRRQVVQQATRADGGVATTLERVPAPGADLAGDIVGQMMAACEFEANLGVIRTEDRMLGSLLDIHA